ncbi:telomere maintenance protein sde2 [Acrodontium crateriforme]|uniref:Telomere maintenance protein sde2 n=1 Tax=Acrodontium crateriforme TaxID=150365 RepID=A0AAQ3RB34_9PEZI|nr:telomere maintenance protein sde2 [Acrodontium crateriforme]
MAAVQTTSLPSIMDTSTHNESMATVNILLTSFAGLGLPRTLSLPVKSTTQTSTVVATLFARTGIPASEYDRLIITTTSNKHLLADSSAPISTFLPEHDATFLPLRLSTRLCGGKGGFGSQLRAAGGRMSSRKNRNSNANPNGSNRNLDGRRLRTVDEAKRLADYLAIKPEMEKKEREERKKRWEAVVEAAERKEAEIRSGKTGVNQGRLDADYVESKEAAEEKTREAILKAMKEGTLVEGRTGSESDEVDEREGEDSVDEDVDEGSSGSSDRATETGRTFFGWDEDEDEDDSEDEEVPDEAAQAYEGKGKGKAA